MSPKIIDRINVFALDDTCCSIIGVPSAASEVLTLRCEAMPAARQGDTARLRLNSRGIYGDARISAVGEVGGRLDETHYTVLVVRLMDSEQEVA